MTDAGWQDDVVLKRIAERPPKSKMESILQGVIVDRHGTEFHLHVVETLAVELSKALQSGDLNLGDTILISVRGRSDATEGAVMTEWHRA